MALLARLSNEDKHRAILPVLMNHKSFDQRSVIVLGGKPVRFQTRLLPGKPIQDGTELFRVWTDPPKAEAEMKGELTGVVSLESGDPLFATLYAMRTLVGNIVREFLPLWAEHLSLGPVPVPTDIEVAM